MSMAGSYTPLSSQAAQHIQTLMKQSTSVWEYRRLQCVSLRRVGMQARDVATIVGLHPDSVLHIWSQFLNGGIEALLGEKRGQVRGKAHLSLEEEEALLAPFEKKAANGHLTIAQQIHKAHCKKVGKELDETVTYRMLRRHGWRKVVPRPHHPKQNKKNQEDFQVFFPQDSDARKSGSDATWMPVSFDVSG